MEALEEVMRQLMEERPHEARERHSSRYASVEQADQKHTYLTIFERTMQEYGIEASHWALKQVKFNKLILQWNRPRL